MKIKRIVLSLLVLLSFSLSAQDWTSDTYEYGQLYEGYIIDLEGEKTEGFIKYRNCYVMQNEVYFYKVNDLESPRKKISTDDLVEYKVADKLYHCIRYSGGNGRLTRANLVLNAEGCIKEYAWYDRAASYNKLIQKKGETDEDYFSRKYPQTDVFYKKGDGLAFTLDYFKDDYSKKLVKFLEENKEMVKKVKKKLDGYTEIRDLRAIFKEYNEACK